MPDVLYVHSGLLGTQTLEVQQLLQDLHVVHPPSPGPQPHSTPLGLFSLCLTHRAPYPVQLPQPTHTMHFVVLLEENVWLFEGLTMPRFVSA